MMISHNIFDFFYIILFFWFKKLTNLDSKVNKQVTTAKHKSKYSTIIVNKPAGQSAQREEPGETEYTHAEQGVHALAAVAPLAAEENQARHVLHFAEPMLSEY